MVVLVFELLSDVSFRLLVSVAAAADGQKAVDHGPLSLLLVL